MIRYHMFIQTGMKGIYSSKQVPLTISSHKIGLDGECSMTIQHDEKTIVQQLQPNTYKFFPLEGDLSVAIVHGSPLQDADIYIIRRKLENIQLLALQNPQRAVESIMAWKEDMETTYQANPAAHAYALIRLMQLSSQSIQSI